jgi:hypothetical protein
VVEVATGIPAAAQMHRTTLTGVWPLAPSAQAMSCGAARCETWRDWQAISPPIGSSRVRSPPIPSTGMRYSAWLAR